MENQNNKGTQGCASTHVGRDREGEGKDGWRGFKSWVFSAIS